MKLESMTVSHEAGNIIQVMPIIDGGPGETGAAGDIDLSKAGIIEFCSACNISVNGGTSVPVRAGSRYGVENISSIHVDTAVKYILG